MSEGTALPSNDGLAWRARESLNSRERALAALDHREPDRVPIDFWATPEIMQRLQRHFACLGSLPHDHNVVPANMTWIIRWQNKSHRDRVWQELLSDPEWQAIFSSSLRPEGYLRTEAKFATEI